MKLVKIGAPRIAEGAGYMIGYMPSFAMPLPLFAHKISAGFASPADDYKEGRLSPTDLVLNASATFWFRAAGRSMEPVIREHDLLMCDFSIEPKVGDIVLASINGEQTVKIFQRIRGEVWLVPENKEYQPLKITEEMDCKLQGVVVHVIHPTHARFRPCGR